MVRIIQHKDTSEFEKNDVEVFERKNGTFGLIVCCIDCGYVHACSDRTNYNPETKTLDKSTICGNCGFHKTLKNGEWV
jgi:hypothetical protein